MLHTCFINIQISHYMYYVSTSLHNSLLRRLVFVPGASLQASNSRSFVSFWFTSPRNEEDKDICYMCKIIGSTQLCKITIYNLTEYWIEIWTIININEDHWLLHRFSHGFTSWCYHISRICQASGVSSLHRSKSSFTLRILAIRSGCKSKLKIETAGEFGKHPCCILLLREFGTNSANLWMKSTEELTFSAIFLAKSTSLYHLT